MSGPEGAPEVTERPSSSLLQMGRLKPREGWWLAQDDTAEAEPDSSGPLAWCETGYKQSPKLGFCFTGQVLIKSAILKPGLLILGCGRLVIAKAIATFTIVFQNEADLNLPFRKKIFSSTLGLGEVGGVQRQ